MAIGTVYLKGYNIILIYITIFSSLYMVFYQIEHKPMNCTSLNHFAWFNEVVLLFSFYALFLFTDFVGDVEFRYNVVGKAFIQYVSGAFGINFLLISVGMAGDIMRSLKKSKYTKKWSEYH